ncbi:MAG: retention module-containing protein, partial [Rhodocyclales bacterium]|nr:retention module-containing protein [Rhodocyclales bacterium]
MFIMADTGNPIGKVASVKGEAFAKNEDGVLRQVRIGDPVFEGEVVQAAPGGHVELAFRDGVAYFLRDKESVTLDGMTFGGSRSDAANIIGKVASVEGQVFAKGQDGSVRQLRVGDPVFEGEVIQTPTTNGRVELAFNSGATYFLRDKESVTLDGMVFGGRLVDSKEAALMPGKSGELEEISRAIAEGNSLERLLEETSAGRPAVFGRTDDGHSFVQLLRIAEGIDPLGYQFGGRDQGRIDEVQGDGADEPNTSNVSEVVPVAKPSDLTTVSLSATPSLVEGGSISYTASLTSAAQSEVVVSLSNGGVIT